ncbi:hypothetical protein EUGRSUZ_H00493 [Eucalyptus grandis]|uniref:Uncharacterized protein n=2 Tax=Eucalyptus grandis TaxID=71139 RepID=A0ACC3JKQ0_EUCGR|nr:hypothetical protein EUGRSUZ_H00493 [Eucalyptus grandis]
MHCLCDIRDIYYYQIIFRVKCQGSWLKRPGRGTPSGTFFFQICPGDCVLNAHMCQLFLSCCLSSATTAQ